MQRSIKRHLKTAVTDRLAGSSAVYFIRQAETGLVKVGLSQVPMRRLSRLQIASPFRLDLIGVLPHARAAAVERRLHTLWQEKAKQGEWFELDEREILAGLSRLRLRGAYVNVAEIERGIRQRIERERLKEKRRGERRKAGRGLRHGRKLTYQQLRDETAAAVDAFDGTQTELAERLGVSRAAISRAIREAGPSLASLQVRLLELLKEGYQLEEERQVWFRVRRKE